jgi:hypothetical protein
MTSVWKRTAFSVVALRGSFILCEGALAATLSPALRPQLTAPGIGTRGFPTVSWGGA